MFSTKIGIFSGYKFMRCDFPDDFSLRDKLWEWLSNILPNAELMEKGDDIIDDWYDKDYILDSEFMDYFFIGQNVVYADTEGDGICLNDLIDTTAECIEFENFNVGEFGRYLDKSINYHGQTGSFLVNYVI